MALLIIPISYLLLILDGLLQLYKTRFNNLVPDRYFYNGSDLNSQLGGISGTSQVTTGNQNSKVYITYGPHLNLVSGQYSYSLLFSSSLSPDKNAADFDLTLDGTPIYAASIFGSKNELKTLNGTFSVPTSMSGELISQAVEAKVFYSGNDDFSVVSLEFKKIEKNKHHRAVCRMERQEIDAAKSS